VDPNAPDAANLTIIRAKEVKTIAKKEIETPRFPEKGVCNSV
jgi:hypothetical protein